jgi:non-ribosomal peptide synthetase component F
MVLLAGFAGLLYRVSGVGDVAVGTPIAGRVRREVEGLIGFFVNTLVVRVRVSGGMSLREMVGEAREACVGAYAHQEVPFERLVEELQPERDLSRPPLFQVWFALHQAAIQGSLELPGVQLTPLETEMPFAKVDLALIMNERPEGLVGRLWYDADLFQPETIELLVGSFERLLEAVIERPDLTLLDIPLTQQPEEVVAADLAGSPHALDEFVF